MTPNGTPDDPHRLQKRTTGMGGKHARRRPSQTKPSRIRLSLPRNLACPDRALDRDDP
jgi:hypothetical protein